MRRLRQARTAVRVGTMAHMVRTAAEQAKVPDVVARRVLDGWMEAVKAAVWFQGRVVVPGFVTFNAQRRTARTVYTVAQDGRTHVNLVKAADVVKVRAAKAWRER